LKFVVDKCFKTCYSKVTTNKKTATAQRKENNMQKNFTKADLKTGMVVETRNGGKYIVLLDTFFNYDKYSHGCDNNVIVKITDYRDWMPLFDYDENLKETYLGDGSFDIIAVYKMDKLSYSHDFEKWQVIWKREKFTDFFDDKEKMEDFLAMSKEDFLDFYSYLTEEEYNLTLNKVRETLGLIF